MADALKQITEALKELPGTVLRNFVAIPARLDGVHKEGKKHIEANYPMMTMESLKAMLPVPVFDDTWTQADEDALVGKFETDPYRAYVLSDAGKPSGNNTEFYPLWKILPRLRGCFPTDIIGEKTSLQFGMQVDIGGGEMR